METLIVRLAARHGRAASWYRFEGDALTVGRGPSNQLIVDDPYVGAEQFVLRRVDEGVVLDVLDTTNPVFINRRPRDGTRHLLRTGDSIETGHTVLTLLSKSSAVEPTRALTFSQWSRLGAWQPMLAIAVLLLTFATNYYVGYLDTVEKPDWAKLASTPVQVCLVLVAWAGFWAIVGRLLRNQPQFFSQLFVTGAAMYLIGQVSVAAEYAAYASGYLPAARVADWTLESLLSFAMVYGNLRLATHLRRPALAAALSVGVVIALAQGIDYIESDDFEYAPDTETLLKPPIAKLRAGKAFEDYQKSLQDLFGELRRHADEDATDDADLLTDLDASSARD